MLNLAPHHKIHIPNGLAVLAAILLLLSSAINTNSDAEIQLSGTDPAPVAQLESSKNNSVNTAAKHKRRSINLGHLLFRR